MTGASPKAKPTLDVALLVEEHADYLFHYALRYFRNEDAARELVQETFLGAVKSASNFEGNSSPRTWLTSILRHRVIDRIRAESRENARRGFIPESDSSDDFFDANEHWTTESGPVHWGSSPDSILEQGEFSAVLKECLSKLPEKLRQIFLLREVEDVEREVLCKEFELSSTNVGVILHRVRLKLRDCLQVNWLT